MKIVTLVYAKGGRFATIYISPRNTVGGFVSGDYGVDIDISVVHPDAIAIQNPYEDLNYDALPEYYKLFNKFNPYMNELNLLIAHISLLF